MNATAACSRDPQPLIGHWCRNLALSLAGNVHSSGKLLTNIPHLSASLVNICWAENSNTTLSKISLSDIRVSLFSILTWKHPFHLSKLCSCCLAVSQHNQIIKNKNLPDIISHTTSFIVHAIFFNYQKYFINTPKTMDFSTLQRQLKSKKYC